MSQLGLNIEPTIAMLKGKAWIEQCLNCGLLAAVPSGHSKLKLGLCPACGRESWSKQRLPVGPFRSVS